MRWEGHVACMIIKKKYFRKVMWEYVEWVKVPQNRVQWHVFANTVINI
jgi:hypothetical protein